MPVHARCVDCQHEHDLGARQNVDDHIPTVCPRCGSPQYRTKPVDVDDVAPDEERIDEVIQGISHVGDETRRNIQQTYAHYLDFEAATVEELTRIDNVGKKIAEDIITAQE